MQLNLIDSGFLSNTKNERNTMSFLQFAGARVAGLNSLWKEFSSVFLYAAPTDSVIALVLIVCLTMW